AHHQLVYADGSHEFAWCTDVVALRIQRVAAIARNQVSVGRPQLRSVVLVQSRPGAEVVPAEICRDALDVGSRLASCRRWLHYRVVNTDGVAVVFEVAEERLYFWYVA